MRVPDAVRKCVAFLYIDEGGTRRPVGSAFFVGHEADSLTFTYTVTARHVIDGATARSDDGKLYLRTNLWAGGSAFSPIDLMEWVGHPTDPTADVAAVMWTPSLTDHDLLFVSSTGSATVGFLSEEKVGLGEDVFVTGLFVNHAGDSRIEPIVRQGTIAAMPMDPILTPMGEAVCYLVELRSIGGLSGSPVFLRRPELRVIEGRVMISEGDGEMRLIGITHGHWDVPVGNSTVRAEAVNMGIGIVTPVDRLLELIESQIQPILDAPKASLEKLKGQLVQVDLDDLGVRRNRRTV